MEDKRIEILRDMDIGKAINKLSIPAIIGFMVMGLYNVADTIFVSRWNYQGAAAVQVIFPVMMLASAIGLAFGVGGGSYISRLLGAEKKERAKEVLATSMFTALFVAVLYIIYCLLNLRTIALTFGAKEDIIALSMQYGFYIIIGAIFVVPSMVFNNALRSEGSAKFSMIGMVGGTVLNIILDPIFIFALDMGVEGAALATMISQGISCSILWSFYLRKKTVIDFGIRHFRFDTEIYREVFKIGLPTFFRQLLFSVSMGVLNQSATRVGGEYLLSAIGISMKAVTIPLFFIFGMGQGIQPVVGYNFGAKNKERLFAAQKYGLKMTFTGALIGGGLLFVLARPIVTVFTDQIQVVDFSVITLRFMAFGIVFTSISNTIAIVYQAIGNGKAALLFSILRQGLLLIPSIILLSRFYMEWGVMMSQSVADFLTLIISVMVYIPFLRKQKMLLGENL